MTVCFVPSSVWLLLIVPSFDMKGLPMEGEFNVVVNEINQRNE